MIKFIFGTKIKNKILDSEPLEYDITQLRKFTQIIEY